MWSKYFRAETSATLFLACDKARLKVVLILVLSL